MFESRGRAMPDNNLLQADVPRGATIIAQTRGTAPGLICPVGHKVVYALPGVPYEMHRHVRARGAGATCSRASARAARPPVIVSRVLRTWGASESALADALRRALRRPGRRGRDDRVPRLGDRGDQGPPHRARRRRAHPPPSLLSAEEELVRALDRRATRRHRLRRRRRDDGRRRRSAPRGARSHPRGGRVGDRRAHREPTGERRGRLGLVPRRRRELRLARSSSTCSAWTVGPVVSGRAAEAMATRRGAAAAQRRRALGHRRRRTRRAGRPAGRDGLRRRVPGRGRRARRPAPAGGPAARARLQRDQRARRPAPGSSRPVRVRRAKECRCWSHSRFASIRRRWDSTRRASSASPRTSTATCEDRVCRVARHRVARRRTGVDGPRADYRDREAGLAVTDDTIWRIYSMTKPVTALLVMSLYEEGLFDLNDDVGQWIQSSPSRACSSAAPPRRPRPRPPGEPVRVHHLLNHTSGLTYGFQRRHAVDEIYRDKGYDFVWAAQQATSRVASRTGARARWSSSPGRTSTTRCPSTCSGASSSSGPARASPRRWPSECSRPWG